MLCCIMQGKIVALFYINKVKITEFCSIEGNTSVLCCIIVFCYCNSRARNI